MAEALGMGAVFLNDLFRRQSERDVCVACDTSQPLICPQCSDTQQCNYIAMTCQACAKAVCVDIDSSDSVGAAPAPKSGTNAGAIAGGVMGGLVALAAVGYLVWRFCIKTRRQPVQQERWEEYQDEAKVGDNATMATAAPGTSSRSRHSVASTVLTRASNVIQIAYIPGVTNRPAPTSPGLLVPPVPPIPIATSTASSPAAPEDQHFFIPGDLRDSTYSGMSGMSDFSDRTSYARSSYAPRSSVASTIYGKSAVIVAPAQTGMRAKPAMVSVKSAASGSSSGTSTPPVPNIDFEKYGRPVAPQSTSPAASTFSVGSTFLNNANQVQTATATPARAMLVRVGSTSKKTNPVTNDDDASTGKTRSLGGQSDTNSTLVDTSPISGDGPFSDPPDTPVSPTRQRSNTSLSAVIEEATRRASGRDSHVPPSTASTPRGKSPFGDEHATHD